MCDHNVSDAIPREMTSSFDSSGQLKIMARISAGKDSSRDTGPREWCLPLENIRPVRAADIASVDHASQAPFRTNDFSWALRNGAFNNK